MNRNQPRQIIEDEVIIKQINEWEFSVSKSEKCLFINTRSYHSRKLGITRTLLQSMLDTMDELVEEQ